MTTLHSLEDGTLDLHEFRHADHVRLAWELIRRDGALDGLARFESGLRRATADAGVPDRFNTTITYALFFLIAERIARAPGQPWDEFETANADLLVWPSPAIEALYDHDALGDPLAREAFVLPRKPVTGS